MRVASRRACPKLLRTGLKSSPPRLLKGSSRQPRSSRRPPSEGRHPAVAGSGCYNPPSSPEGRAGRPPGLGTCPAAGSGRVTRTAFLLLLVFGVTYGIWRHRREARVHARVDRPPADPGDHVHAHGHLLERWFHGALSAGALVLVIGISPCALLVPILFSASVEGTGALLASALGFALCTVGTMVGVTVFAMRGIRRIDLPFFAHYGDLISGALVSAVGLLMMLHES